MKIVIIAVVALLVLGGGGAAAFFILAGGEPEVVAEEGAEGAASMEENREALYVSLNPAFMVTFKHGNGLRYLQTELNVMSYEPDVIKEIEMNRPAVRNNILMHLSSQDYDTLESVAGRQALRETVKVAVQETLRTELPVEAIYFNTFVIQ